MSGPSHIGGTNAFAYSVAYTPSGVGSALIITVIGYNANSVTSVSDSQRQTVETDFAFTEISSSSLLYLGVYRIQGVLPGSHTISINTPGGWNNPAIFVDEVSDIVGVDAGAGTLTGGIGDSASALTESVTPTAANDYLHAIFTSKVSSVTYSAYTNSFTQAQSADTDPPSTATAYLVPSASGTPVDAGATLSASNYWAALLIPYLYGVVPSVTSVNGGAPIAEGATAIPFTGGNFESGMTASIVQGANTVAQSNVVYTDATDGTFDLVMEPMSGPQLAATDSVYSAGFEVTAGGNTSVSFPVQLTPPTGVLFKTLLSVIPTAPMRFETLPDLAINDQVWAAGNSTGTAGAPPGLVLNSDGSFEFAPGYTPQDFWVRVYIAADSAYTPWAKITVTGMQPGGFW
jgi:hypothetical protein